MIAIWVAAIFCSNSARSSTDILAICGYLYTYWSITDSSSAFNSFSSCIIKGRGDRGDLSSKQLTFWLILTTSYFLMLLRRIISGEALDVAAFCDFKMLAVDVWCGFGLNRPIGSGLRVPSLKEMFLRVTMRTYLSKIFY